MKTVSPSRKIDVRKTDARKLDGRRRINGLKDRPAAVVSVKATGRQVPKAEPEGMMPHPADLTEKVSAGVSEAPAIPERQ